MRLTVVSLTLLSAHAFALPNRAMRNGHQQCSVNDFHSKRSIMFLGSQNMANTGEKMSSKALATSINGGGAPARNIQHTLKVGGYFALWYGLNIGYNIYNKKALNALPLPWTMALV